MSPRYQRLERKALGVLEQNDRVTHTIPSHGIYTHAWLWDSGFIAIGLRHIDPTRAAQEVDTILEGQWQNGMIPNMRFAPGTPDKIMWASRRHPQSPRNIQTSGVSQPPVLAEAVRRVGEKLDRDDRDAFTKTAIGRIAAHHQWVYNERNPNGNGLWAAVHPWETGMENTPTWMEHMRTLDWGISGNVLHELGSRASHLVRRDTKHAPAHQRADRYEGALFFMSFMKLRHARYDSKRLDGGYPLHFEDVALNSIFVRNNQILEELADEYDMPLSDDLRESMSQTRQSLEQLRNPVDGLYYPRDAVSGRQVKIPTIASLMPLYAGSSPNERLDALAKHTQNPETFGLPFGIPTVPYNSPYYRVGSYWAAPTWVNTNWLLIDGLKRSGHDHRAQRLARSTLQMANIGGMHEYFDAQTAEGLGAKNFSWTAALILDLIKQGY